MMLSRKLDILITDDHQLLREGLIKLLYKSYPDSQIVGAGNGKEALEICKQTSFDIVLLDLDMPELDGFDTSSELLKQYPDTRILILSGYSDDKYIYHLVELGVHGFISKEASPEMLKDAIESILSKGFYFSDEMVQSMRRGIIQKSSKPSFRSADLTHRELTVLKQICLEKTTRQIADAVHLSERTVEKIRAGLAVKLDVKGTAGLVRYAVRNGLDL